jgi:hypothetical protein
MQAKPFMRGAFWLPLALVALEMSGCFSFAPTPAPEPTATTQQTSQPTPGAFPAFGDWRLGYIAALSNKLHIITLDGKVDLTGSVSSPGAGPVAPDGRALVFGAGIFNLRAAPSGPQTIPIGGARGYAWSPDSTHLVFHGQNDCCWTVLDITTGQTMVVPGNGVAQWQGDVIGWIDATHLAVDDATTDQSAIILSSLDMTSGALRKIASISTTGLGSPAFDLSPDGSELLLTNYAGEGQGDIDSVVEVIDTSTGQKHRLPTILSVTGGGQFGIIWKAGSQQVLAISTTSYLFDLAHDTAMPFAAGAMPIGWAPDTGTLYVQSKVTGTFDTYQISSMAAPPPATATQPLFRIVTDTFLVGFVRTR